MFFEAEEKSQAAPPPCGLLRTECCFRGVLTPQPPSGSSVQNQQELLGSHWGYGEIWQNMRLVKAPRGTEGSFRNTELPHMSSTQAMCSPCAQGWELRQWPGCVGFNPVSKASSHQTSSNGREGDSKKMPVVQTPPQLKEGLGCSRSSDYKNTGMRHCQLEQCST